MHQQKIVLKIDLDQREVPHGDLIGPVMTSHLAALANSTWISTRCGTPWMSVNLLDPVRGSLALEIVPLHPTGVTTPLRNGRHIDRLDPLEVSHQNL